MFTHSISPVLLNIGSFEIRYYGIIYALGFILAYFFIEKLRKEKQVDLDTESYLFYILLGTLIGARIFYILFYNLPFYIKNPFEILALWHGGLSFHGGLLGAAIAAYLFSRKCNIKFLKLADITSIPLAFGLFLGRIGNFLNGELYG